jgi:TRAP transporter TAXI family solute receptor
MKLTLFFVVLGIALFFVGLHFVDPAPPRRIVMATGMEGGAYQEFGKRYQQALADDGITVELRQTSGSLENLRLLREGAVDLAFVQTGVAGAAERPGLMSLASLGFEPLWVFYRGEPLQRLRDLRNKRLATGEPQSGTRALCLRLLGDNGLTNTAADVPIGGADAARALREGSVDAAFFVAAIHAPLVQSLLADPAIHLLSFDRTEAYASRYPFLSKLVLPEGVIDLEKNIPGRDIHLIAPAMTFVARENFHPAVANLLVRTATDVHGQRGVFERAGQFPSAEFVDIPVNEETRHALAHGPSFLSRHLPFWLASGVERLAILILPLLTLLIPLLRMAPPIYVWRVRRQIYRWYDKLVQFEQESRAVRHSSAAGQERIREQILRLSDEVSRVKVPLSYMDELYRLRSHIAMVLESKFDDPVPRKAAERRNPETPGTDAGTDGQRPAADGSPHKAD